MLMVIHTQDFSGVGVSYYCDVLSTINSDTLPLEPQDHMFVKYIEMYYIQENG